MRQRVICLTVLLVWVTPLYAADYFVDGTNHKVAYGCDAQRVVSLTPSVTEMLFFLGLGDRVVGRTSYCNFPPEVMKLPSVGGFVDTSLEKIVALNPDLVVAYQGNSLELVSQLRQLHIQVVAFPEAYSLSGVGFQMRQLHRIAGKPGAKEPAQLIKWRDLAEPFGDDLTRLKPAPTVFYGMPGEVTYSAAPGSFINDMIGMAGGRNVVPKGNDRWPQVGAEFILAAQPDWLLISTSCTGHTELKQASDDIHASLAKDQVWSKLKAVQQNHIVVINADVLLRPGPRILDALEQLSAALDGSTQ